MSRCRHPRTSVSEVTRCYTGPVGERENQRAHGNVCHHETCARCGSERRTNSNQGARESSGWYRPEAGCGHDLAVLAARPEPEEDEPATCPACGGDGVTMGILGAREHFRCRQCGIDFSTEGNS